MLSAIYGWIKNIAFYFILIMMITHLLPNNNYKKYLKFATGLILIILVINPIMSLLGTNINLDNTLMIESFKEEYAGIKNTGKGLQGIQEEQLIIAYEQEIAAQIGAIVESNGLFPVDIQVTLGTDEQGNIEDLEKIKIIASIQAEKSIYIEEIDVGQEKEESLEEINIKKDIQEVYNISAGNINISIQR